MHKPTLGAGPAPFGRLPDGRTVELFTVLNGNGVELRAMSYGGIIQSLRIPGRDGVPEDVVLGFDSLEGYLPNPHYFGAIIGRYANRIAGGRFALDGRHYQLATNNGPNHLHGGVRGFDQALWRGVPFALDDAAGVRFLHTSADGEEGYPGRIDVEVSYTLTRADELIFDYRAISDRPTVVNLTQHSYFNLAGAGRGDVLGHQLTIFADRFTPIDASSIPEGDHLPVAGTPFDFRRAKAIGKDIDADDRQLRHGRGYDHNFVLTRSGTGLAPAARLLEPRSGRFVEVATTEPGLQLYTGNFLDGGRAGKGGHRYARHAGVTLETQHFPDSPNHPDFPSTVLHPAEVYRSRTVLRFGVAESPPEG